MTQTHTHIKQVEPQKFRSRYRNRAVIFFALALIVSMLMQFSFDPHPYFRWDGTFWFYPAFGLLASVALVLVSKMLGFVLKRRETYWDDKA